MRIDTIPIVVVVWHMPGCGACEEFIPRFRVIAEKYKSCVPAVLVDATKHEKAADRYRVRSTPTTMIIRHGRRSVMQIEGAGSDADIERLYGYAFYGLDCKLD